MITELTLLTFQGLGSLHTLKIAGNSINDISDGAFLPLNNVTSLLLQKKNVASLSSLMFKGLVSLQILGMSENNISSLECDVFRHIDSCKSIDLSNNKISNICHGVFTNMSNLQSELNLRGNSLSSLNPYQLIGLSNLQILDLNFNKIQHLPSAVFKYLTNCISLHLSYNKIKSIGIGAFHNMSNLKKLFFKRNYLQAIPFNVFDERILFNMACHFKPLQLHLSNTVLHCTSCCWMGQGWVTFVDLARLKCKTYFYPIVGHHFKITKYHNTHDWLRYKCFENSSSSYPLKCSKVTKHAETIDNTENTSSVATLHGSTVFNNVTTCNVTDKQNEIVNTEPILYISLPLVLSCIGIVCGLTFLCINLREKRIFRQELGR